MYRAAFSLSVFVLVILCAAAAPVHGLIFADGFESGDTSAWSATVPARPGTSCASAADVSAGPFPYQLTGTFDDEPAVGPSCDTTATNTVWFTYTPSLTDEFEITTTNNTATNAYSRLAVFQGTSCDPYGTEISCEATTGKTASVTASLTAGTTYLIMFFTDGDPYTMVDPEIDVAPVLGAPGANCASAADVTGGAFPYQLLGAFDDDSAAGPSCDSTATNTAWFTNTSSTSDYFVTVP
jgi:hypothetical protein